MSSVNGESANKLRELEQTLRQIPDVTGVQIVGEDVPSEIHIVSTAARSPKMVARDVQTLAAAAFNIPIDHRIVSVVQLDDGSEPDSPKASKKSRPIIERISTESRGGETVITVALEWPDGKLTAGEAFAGTSRQSRAQAGTAAALKAVQAELAGVGCVVEIEGISLYQTNMDATVLVHAILMDAGTSVPVAGCAVAQDDVASAAAKALLHALNRRLTR